MRIQHQNVVTDQHYLTLPGQSPVYVGNSTTNRAFDQHTQQYTNNQQQYGGQSQYNAQQQQYNDAQQYGGQQYVNTQQPQQLQQLQQPQQQVVTHAGSDDQSNNSGWLYQPSSDENQGTMDYIVEIVNTTGSRLFIEATDAAGNILNGGFAAPKKNFTTTFRDAMPMKSPILVVLRDPDQNNAPELRRYRIKTPTSSYDGKTLKINIISGGRYQALVDDEVYYENDPND